MGKELNFFGIRTVIESDDEEFLHIAANSLVFFSASSDKNPPLVDNLTLRVTFLKDRSVDLAKAAGGYHKIGLKAYKLENSYVYGDDGLVVHARKTGNEIQIVAYPETRKDIRGIIKKALLMKSADNFLRVRKLIIFPIFHLLEKHLNLFLLHGSAVNYKGHGIVMAGLAGVGKSTGAIAMTLNGTDNTSFLTDNFLLFDREKIYPFPEFIRLRDDMLTSMGDISKLGAPVMRRFKRNHYVFPDALISGRISPKVIFIPFLSDSGYVKEISADIAMDRLLLANDHVKEFQMYHHSGLLGYLDYPEESTYRKRIKALESLLSGTAIFELGIERGQETSHTVRNACEHII